jgi:hypothetical protein
MQYGDSPNGGQTARRRNRAQKTGEKGKKGLEKPRSRVALRRQARIENCL